MVPWFVSKLYVGDYQRVDNGLLVVDRKQNLQEVIGNVTQQHERFRNELVRAKKAGIKVVILIEQGKHVRSIEDVEKWQNPRLKDSPKATTGEKLAKIMRTQAERYGVEWRFCAKEETGRCIMEILGVLNDGVH